MYYLLRLAGIGGSQESKWRKHEAATHVVKGLGKALSCTTQGRVFGAGI